MLLGPKATASRGVGSGVVRVPMSTWERKLTPWDRVLGFVGVQCMFLGQCPSPGKPGTVCQPSGKVEVPKPDMQKNCSLWLKQDLGTHGLM